MRQWKEKRVWVIETLEVVCSTFVNFFFIIYWFMFTMVCRVIITFQKPEVSAFLKSRQWARWEIFYFTSLRCGLLCFLNGCMLVFFWLLSLLETMYQFFLKKIGNQILRRPKFGAGNRVMEMVTEPYRLTRRCEVTAILILYGLPRYQ